MGKRHSPKQIVRKLRQAEARLAAGSTVPEAARELGMDVKALAHQLLAMMLQQ